MDLIFSKSSINPTIAKGKQIIGENKSHQIQNKKIIKASKNTN